MVFLNVNESTGVIGRGSNLASSDHFKDNVLNAIKLGDIADITPINIFNELQKYNGYKCIAYYNNGDGHGDTWHPDSPIVYVNNTGSTDYNVIIYNGVNEAFIAPVLFSDIIIDTSIDTSKDQTHICFDKNFADADVADVNQMIPIMMSNDAMHYYFGKKVGDKYLLPNILFENYFEVMSGAHHADMPHLDIANITDFNTLVKTFDADTLDKYMYCEVLIGTTGRTMAYNYYDLDYIVNYNDSDRTKVTLNVGDITLFYLRLNLTNIQDQVASTAVGKNNSIIKLLDGINKINAELRIFENNTEYHSFFGNYENDNAMGYRIFRYESINPLYDVAIKATNLKKYEIYYIDDTVLTNPPIKHKNYPIRYIEATSTQWNLDPDNRIKTYIDDSGILSVILDNNKQIPLYTVTINAKIQLNARYEPLPEYVPQDYSVELYEEPPPPPVEPTDPYVQKQESLVSFFERMNSAHGNSGKEAFKINEVTVVDSYDSLIRNGLQNDNKTIYFVPNSIIKKPLIKLKRHKHMYWKGKRVEIFDKNIGVKNIPNGTYYYLGKPINF
jgi:hypothetical protein